VSMGGGGSTRGCGSEIVGLRDGSSVGARNVKGYISTPQKRIIGAGMRSFQQEWGTRGGGEGKRKGKNTLGASI